MEYICSLKIEAKTKLKEGHKQNVFGSTDYCGYSFL